MKSKKMRKVWLVLAIVVVFIIGFFVGRVGAQDRESAVQEERTTQIVEVKVGTQTIENTLTSSGEIASSDTEKLELSTSKYFKTMCAEEGDIVKAGENILQYSNGTYLVAEYDCLINSYSVPETGKKCTSSHYVEVQNLANMTMNLQVNESEINKIAKGQEVNIEVSAIEDKTYTGTIKSVSSVGNYSTSGTTFQAVVEFKNDGNVKVGMSASCTIILEKAENCIAVPIQAVQTNNEQKYVVVVDNSGNTQNVNIETGISNDTYVQVVSGLNGGETIQMVQTVTNSRSNSQRGGTNFNPEQMGSDGQMPSNMQRPEQGQGQMPSNRN